MTESAEEHDVTELQYAPHSVFLTLDDDGEIVNAGGNELLDAGWLTVAEVGADNSRYWCQTCDVGIDDPEEARRHLRGDVDV